MPAFRRRSPMRTRREPKNLFWTRDTVATSLAASASASVVNFSSKLDTALGRTVNNWTIERLILDIQFTVPAATSPGAAYTGFLGVALIDGDAATAGAYPEPWGDNVSWMWAYGARLYADHTVPPSFGSPAVPHSASHVQVDIRNKRRIKQAGQSLMMVGYHDNGLSANPGINVIYSALWNVR